MTIPMWTPFALLAAVCVVLPAPDWLQLRRVNWPIVACLVYCLTVWALAGVAIWWLVW